MATPSNGQRAADMMTPNRPMSAAMSRQSYMRARELGRGTPAQPGVQMPGQQAQGQPATGNPQQMPARGRGRRNGPGGANDGNFAERGYQGGKLGGRGGFTSANVNNGTGPMGSRDRANQFLQDFNGAQPIGQTQPAQPLPAGLAVQNPGAVGDAQQMGQMTQQPALGQPAPPAQPAPGIQQPLAQQPMQAPQAPQQAQPVQTMGVQGQQAMPPQASDTYMHGPRGVQGSPAQPVNGVQFQQNPAGGPVRPMPAGGMSSRLPGGGMGPPQQIQPTGPGASPTQGMASRLGGGMGPPPPTPQQPAVGMAQRLGGGMGPPQPTPQQPSMGMAQRLGGGMGPPRRGGPVAGPQGGGAAAPGASIQPVQGPRV